MDRLLMEALKDWRDRPGRLPLILKGARQVGKSWLLQEFGRTCFEDTVYVNFENAGNLGRRLCQAAGEPVRRPFGPAQTVFCGGRDAPGRPNA